MDSSPEVESLLGENSLGSCVSRRDAGRTNSASLFSLACRDPSVSKSIERIFKIWEDRNVYPEETIAVLKEALSKFPYISLFPWPVVCFVRAYTSQTD